MADMAMTDKIESTPAANSELSNRFSLESTEEFMARALKTVEAVPTEVKQLLDGISAKLASLPESYRTDLLAMHSSMNAQDFPLWHMLNERH
jgi:hypothetical protein